MHLEGPWLSTTGKRKGKQKFRSAEHAKKARELDDDWKALQKKWGIEQEERKRRRGLSSPVMLPTQAGPYVRDTGPRLPSLNPTDMSPCTKKDSPKYTGTLIKGIATMHKSNAVPVINDEQAVEISKMRR